MTSLTDLNIPLVLHKLPLIFPSNLHEGLDDLSRSGGDTGEVDGSRVSGEFRGWNGGTEDDVFHDLHQETNESKQKTDQLGKEERTTGRELRLTVLTEVT